MGSDNFFSKVASVDPLAQALHLPGSDKYAQAVAQRNAGATDVNGGPYAGIAPTLAAANAGYVAGGPGAPKGWTQENLGSNPGGVFGFGMRNAGNVGQGVFGPVGNLYGNSNGAAQSTVNNPYAQAARGASQQGNQNGY
jgi:hypothetical protein